MAIRIRSFIQFQHQYLRQEATQSRVDRYKQSL